MPLVKKEFTSSGSWVAPSGVTQVLLIGYGGGGGGGIGVKDSWRPTYYLAGPGGGGSLLSSFYVTVVPNTSYTITIGAGGAGATSVLPNDGSDTTFGSLATFRGGQRSYDFETHNHNGGLSVRMSDNSSALLYNALAPTKNIGGPGYGGVGTGINSSSMITTGFYSVQGFSGGTQGSTGAGSTYGGGGGGGGPGGVGGNGSNGTNSGNSAAGGSAAANSGAGGGGSGAVSGGGNIAGNGGAGGSGKLTVIWLEG